MGARKLLEVIPSEDRSTSTPEWLFDLKRLPVVDPASLGLEGPAIDPVNYFTTSGEAVVKMGKLLVDVSDLAVRVLDHEGASAILAARVVVEAMAAYQGAYQKLLALRGLGENQRVSFLETVGKEDDGRWRLRLAYPRTPEAKAKRPQPRVKG